MSEHRTIPLLPEGEDLLQASSHPPFSELIQLQLTHTHNTTGRPLGSLLHPSQPPSRLSFILFSFPISPSPPTNLNFHSTLQTHTLFHSLPTPALPTTPSLISSPLF